LRGDIPIPVSPRLNKPVPAIVAIRDNRSMLENGPNHTASLESLDPAAASAVAALEHDPFYRSISVAYEHDASLRRNVPARYFAYSIREGSDLGRCVHLPDPAQGVAVWLLPRLRMPNPAPQTTSERSCERPSARKAAPTTTASSIS
jgi:hypothetical protein